jgi:hypothetical protein
MAETKARAKRKRSQSSRKPRARSGGSASKSPSPASGSGKSDGAERIDSARRAVGHTAKDAGQAVGRAASRAKLPLMAGGAMLVGAAGGLAIGSRQGRRHRRMGLPIPRRPQVKVRSRDVARAAKEVGAFGAQVGHLATELQRAREAADGGKQHRSPLEVVLEGLTARRPRA